MDPRAPLLGLTALLATPLGLAAPLQDEVPYEDPLDMDDPWAPFPLPELDLPESAPGRGDGLLLVDGRRWEGPVEVGDFATWWFTPPDGTPRRVHGDAVVLAEFEGELDYRGPDEVLVAAIARGRISTSGSSPSRRSRTTPPRERRRTPSACWTWPGPTG